MTVTTNAGTESPLRVSRRKSSSRESTTTSSTGCSPRRRSRRRAGARLPAVLLLHPHLSADLGRAVVPRRRRLRADEAGPHGGLRAGRQRRGGRALQDVRAGSDARSASTRGLAHRAAHSRGGRAGRRLARPLPHQPTERALGGHYVIEEFGLPMINALYEGFRRYPGWNVEDFAYFHLHMLIEGDHVDWIAAAVERICGAPGRARRRARRRRPDHRAAASASGRGCIAARSTIPRPPPQRPSGASDLPPAARHGDRRRRAGGAVRSAAAGPRERCRTRSSPTRSGAAWTCSATSCWRWYCNELAISGSGCDLSAYLGAGPLAPQRRALRRVRARHQPRRAPNWLPGRVTALESDGPRFRCRVESEGRPRELRARSVILATGIRRARSSRG